MEKKRGCFVVSTSSPHRWIFFSPRIQGQSENVRREVKLADYVSLNGFFLHPKAWSQNFADAGQMTVVVRFRCSTVRQERVTCDVTFHPGKSVRVQIFLPFML